MNKTDDELRALLCELVKQPKESEWLEFKHNSAEEKDIGEYISALSNSAALNTKQVAYIIWGIEDETHKILGTEFSPTRKKIGNEELENWLLRSLTPKIDFKFYEFSFEDKNIVLLEISPASVSPVQFQNIEYIRIGSYKKKLKDYPEKERKLWRAFDKEPFESRIAISNASDNKVLKLINYPSYFDLLNLPLPDNKQGILSALESEKMIIKNDSNRWDITNLAAVLFAKKLTEFDSLSRKSIRVITYKGNDRIDTIKEQVVSFGYATGFEGIIDYIITQIPSHEIIGKAFRKDSLMYPELALRELVANAIIHQDFSILGQSVMIEIFSDRVEVVNPGKPLVDIERLLDTPPRSRNEKIASFMRRIGICEERGSGIDKIVNQTEICILPAPLFEVSGENTICVLFAYKPLKESNVAPRMRAYIPIWA